MIVKVVPYNPHWPASFEVEALELKQILGKNLEKVHHIGSTAVPDLMAKPIIDIMLEVSDLDALDAKNTEMEVFGYEVLGEYGIPRRRYFRKGGDNRTHQIHAFPSGDIHVTRHVAFREYLIAHEDIAREYGKLKLEIAQQCNNDIEKYCDGKDPFVELHEKKALDWYGKRENPTYSSDTAPPL
ncbi:MAG: GrpB family protein [Bacteroidota bacterium]